MTKRTRNATCALCLKKFSKSGFGRHLQTCIAKHIEQLPAKKSLKTIHCRISGLYAQKYWMHILIPAKFSLADLDNFLRYTWVECCGHLSEFTFEKPFRGEPLPMGAQLDKIAEVSDKIHYVYDFGSSTELEITFLGHHPQNIADEGGITILARNEPPEYTCDICQKRPSTVICSYCLHDVEEGFYCEQCAREHPCFLDDDGNYSDDYADPIPNSPRMGVCGYTGPASF